MFVGHLTGFDVIKTRYSPQMIRIPDMEPRHGDFTDRFDYNIYITKTHQCTLKLLRWINITIHSLPLYMEERR